MVSVIIPARNERFLSNTIKDVLQHSTGEVEVIAVLDGYWMPFKEVVDDKRVIYLHRGKSHGMRAAINAGVAVSKGKYIMKLDAHCMLADGWDEALKADCEKDWVVVPRRKRLDGEKWAIQPTDKPDIDYMYLSYPSNPNDRGGPGLHGRLWDSKNRDASLDGEKIVDLMSAQGSCYFLHREYFDWLELMDVENYGDFGCEFQEVGLKCWLSGGRVVRNKKTWYAHLHKGKVYGRGYPLSKRNYQKAVDYARTWMYVKRRWHKQTLDFEWLIDKFTPVPEWPDRWKEIRGELQ